MDYTCRLTIAAPAGLVYRAIVDPALWPQYMRGLASVETLEGSAGNPGCRNRLSFEYGGMPLTMDEQVTRVDPGRRYDTIYTAGPVKNWCSSRLADTPDGGTQWQLDCAWEFSGLEAGDGDEERFRATTEQQMADLKHWAERQAAHPSPNPVA